MPAPGLTRILNTGLRFATLGIRFVFVFFLAKFLSAESVGYYGIFTASVGYAIFLVGAEFYVYVTRQILAVEVNERARMLKGQAALAGVLYVGWLPIILVFAPHSGWPVSLLYWFLPILVFEHFNQEIFRILVVMQDQLSASALLFVRQGSWAIVVVALMALNETSRNLDLVMLIWLLAGALTAILGGLRLRQLEIGGWHAAIDWPWVWRGVRVAAPFLLATLALRGTLVLDRYWLEALGGIEIVGSYVLFFGVMSALLVFLDAAVFSFTYPELIKHNLNNERAVARAKVRAMLRQTLVIAFGFSGVAWFSMPVILAWIGDPVHESFLGLFPALILAMVFYALSQVPHFGLYALGKDRLILVSHLAAFATFVMATFAASRHFGPYAVMIGLTLSFGVLLCAKTIAYLRFTHQAKPAP